MISLLKKQTPGSVMGLAFEKSRIEGVLLRRTNNAVEVQRSFQASLSLDPLTNDPELVGREIRNHLNEAGVREKRCAVSIPLNWALTLPVKIPAIPEADVSSFLDIEAERGFPYAPADLAISCSRYRLPNGEQHATIVAIPKNHLTLLEKALRAAQLKPVSFSLGIAALQDAAKEPSIGILTLVVGENGVELQVSAGGGIVALRSLEGAVEANGFERNIDADLIVREIKITLGQLPNELRGTVRKVKVFGRAELAQHLAGDLKARMNSMGLDVALGLAQPVNGFAVPLQPGKALSPALSMAMREVTGKAAGFEFLPPKVSAWTQATARFSSRKLVSTGAAAGAILLLTSAAFAWQYWTLSSLESEWRAKAPRVTEIDNFQQQIRKFRPWFDESFRSLTILRKLTETFPEDGSVSAKMLEIRDLSRVSCSGQAKDKQALLKVLEKLRVNKQFADLKIDRMQGSAPVQFSFDFRYLEGVAHDN